MSIIISTSLTVQGQPSPRFHVEACFPFRNREWTIVTIECAVVIFVQTNRRHTLPARNKRKNK